MINFSLTVHAAEGARKIFKSLLILAALMAPLCSAVVFADESAPPPDDSGLIGDPHHLEPITNSWNPFRYSEGYTFGTITDVKSSGVFIKTLDGEMRLGTASASGGILDEKCFQNRMESAPADKQTEEYNLYQSNATRSCTDVVNPWHFANINIGLLNQAEQMEGAYSIVLYRSYSWVPLVASPNIIEKIYPVDASLVKIGDYYEKTGFSAEELIHYSRGYIEGHFVKASMENVIRKSYDTIIQVGPAGDVFQQMSVDDDQLFNFIVRAMASGQYLRISYYVLYGPMASVDNFVRGYKTDRRIYRVEAVESPSLEGQPEPQRSQP